MELVISQVSDGAELYMFVASLWLETTRRTVAERSVIGDCMHRIIVVLAEGLRDPSSEFDWIGSIGRVALGVRGNHDHDERRAQ